MKTPDALAVRAMADRLIAHCHAAVRQQGLQVRRETDFRIWARELGRAPGITAVSQAFDPDYCDLSDAYWLRLHDGETLLGTIAGKRVEGDYLDQQRDGTLWFGRRAADFERVELAVPDTVPAMSGTQAYYGALWLHPDVRGGGMATIMARMIRATGMRDWLPDWQCGGVLQALAIRNIPTRVYGYAHCVRISEEVHFPVTGKPAVLYMPWESRQEWFESSRVFLEIEGGVRRRTAPPRPQPSLSAVE